VDTDFNLILLGIMRFRGDRAPADVLCTFQSSDYVLACHVSEDENLFSASKDGIQLWDPISGKSFRTLQEADWVTCLTTGRGSTAGCIFSGSWDRVVKQRRINDGSTIQDSRHITYAHADLCCNTKFHAAFSSSSFMKAS